MNSTEVGLLIFVAVCWIFSIVLFYKGIQHNNPAGIMGGGVLIVMLPFIWADMYHRIIMTGG